MLYTTEANEVACQPDPRRNELLTLANEVTGAPFRVTSQGSERSVADRILAIKARKIGDWKSEIEEVLNKVEERLREFEDLKKSLDNYYELCIQISKID